MRPQQSQKEREREWERGLRWFLNEFARDTCLRRYRRQLSGNMAVLLECIDRIRCCPAQSASASKHYHQHTFFHQNVQKTANGLVPINMHFGGTLFPTQGSPDKSTKLNKQMYLCCWRCLLTLSPSLSVSISHNETFALNGFVCVALVCVCLRWARIRP